jgi:hypothetical protein
MRQGESPNLLDRATIRGLLGLLIAAGAVGGCSGINLTWTPPTPNPTLFPSDYRAEITNTLRTHLSNPTNIRDAFISEPILRPVAGTPLYVSCIRYNPRDSKGQYLGNQENVAIFLDGRLNQFLPVNRELCANVNYQRFPEAEAMRP